MILKRRDKEPFVKKIGNYIWPSMGWGRFLSYVKKRLVRLSDTPRNVALGVSFGLACSFNPYVGTHIIQAAILSYLFRANIAASALGTLFGNPSTFPLMWWAAIATGQALAHVFGMEVTESVHQGMVLSDLLAEAHNDPMGLLLPWTLGAYVIGIATIPACYLICYPLIEASKAARAKVIEARKAWIKHKRERQDKHHDKNH